MADLTFSTTLLGQFLEDMEAYAEVKLVHSVKACCQVHTELFYSHTLMPVSRDAQSTFFISSLTVISEFGYLPIPSVNLIPVFC